MTDVWRAPDACRNAPREPAWCARGPRAWSWVAGFSRSEGCTLRPGHDSRGLSAVVAGLDPAPIIFARNLYKDGYADRSPRMTWSGRAVSTPSRSIRMMKSLDMLFTKAADLPVVLICHRRPRLPSTVETPHLRAYPVPDKRGVSRSS